MDNATSTGCIPGPVYTKIEYCWQCICYHELGKHLNAAASNVTWTPHVYQAELTRIALALEDIAKALREEK